MAAKYFGVASVLPTKTNRYWLAHIAFVVLGELDVILDLLVRDDPSDEQEVQPPFVAQQGFQRRAARRGGNPLGVDRDREHARVVEAEIFKLLAVVFRIAKRLVGVADERLQVLAAEHRQPVDGRVVARKEMRRGDVVILQHAA